MNLLTNLTNQLASLAIAVAGIYAVGYGIYVFFASAIDKLNSVNSDVSKALIAGGFTFMGAVLAVVVGKILEQHIKIRHYVREKNIPIYEHKVKTFFETLFAQKKGMEPKSEAELQKAFLEFTEKLMVWGSSEVIQSWQQFRQHDWQGAPPVEGFRRLELVQPGLLDPFPLWA